MATADSASIKSAFALAIEATPGTEETAPDVYDYLTGDPGFNPVQTLLRPAFVNERSRQKAVMGSYHTEGSIPLMFDFEGAAPYLIYGALGTKASALQGTTAYKHTFTTGDAIPSFTLWLKRGATEQVTGPYTMVRSLVFVQEVDAPLVMTTNVISQKDKIASSYGTASYSTVAPVGNQHLQVSIGGSTSGQAAVVHRTRILLENDLDPAAGKVHNSRFYTGMVNGGLNVSGSIEMWFDSDTEVERFWGDSSTPATEAGNAPENVELIFTWDSGVEIETSYNYKLILTVPKAVYETSTVSLDGTRVKQTITFGALEHATNGDFKAEVYNSVTTY